LARHAVDRVEVSELFPGADQTPRRLTSAAEGDPEPGGDFEVLEELGRGARTAVYRVRRDGVEYALKTLRHPGVGDSQVQAEFCREAAILARVDHPGVPKVFDVGISRGRPYLVLEYLRGRSLAQLIEDGPLDEALLVRWAADVAAALSAAHRGRAGPP
jgi:serine/threonine protein kinase